MSKFDEYRAEKKRLNQAIQWAKLIGKPYNGGGGGVGCLYRATASMEIYHQEYNGSKNYHESNEIKCFNDYISEAVKSLGNSVIDIALKMWANRVSELAAQAKVEYDALVQDANLEVANEQV